MSLLGLAIIGRRNEPLYLCDCVRVLHEAKQQPARRGGGGEDFVAAEEKSKRVGDEEGTQQGSNNSINFEEKEKEDQPTTTTNSLETATNDPFGFLEAARNCDLGQSLSFDHSCCLHAALDHLEELIETSAAGLPVVKKGRTGHWLGLLTSHNDDDDDEHSSIYGYITATNIKFLVLVQPPVIKESNVRLFLNVIHDSFITYSLNPFSSVKAGQRIQSQKFDSHIREAVRDYEDNRLQTS